MAGVAGLASGLYARSTCGEVARADAKNELWYDRPAQKWTEALPVGNGRLGGMVWGGIDSEHIDLNEDTLWSGEPYDNVNPRGLSSLPHIRALLLSGDDAGAQKLVEKDLNGRNNQSYMPLGALEIAYLWKEQALATSFRRALELNTGVAATSFCRNGVHYRRDVFVSRVDNVLAVRLEADRSASVSVAIRLSTQLQGSVTAVGNVLKMTGRAPAFVDPHYVPEGIIRYETGPEAKGMRFACWLRLLCDGGSVQIRDGHLVATDCNSATLLLAAGTSYNGPARSPSRQGLDANALCRNALDVAATKSYSQLRSAHVADHNALFHRVAIDLGTSRNHELPTDLRLQRFAMDHDPSLIALYAQFGRYLLIAGSRAGTQPLNLQGIWNKDIRPPWSSNWTLNCNAEINYWGVEASNLAECHLPLVDMTRELTWDGAHVARTLYGARGWVAHHNTDIWRQTAPVAGSALWSIFQVGSAWLCQHLWEHYRFSCDLDYLRSVWSILSGAGRFYLDNMITEPSHAWLVTSPDTNFENQFRRPDGHVGCVCMGPTGSMQMIRQLFCNLIEGSGLLGVDMDLRRELEAAVLRLPPMQVSPSTGELQEWLQDWQRVAACQVLSSWGCICSSQITPRRTPELALALKKTFEHGSWWKRGLVGSWQGAFQANAYARLHDAETALAVLEKHLAVSVNPNMTAHFDLSPGGKADRWIPDWQIDGNMGIMAAVFEMLLQSHDDELHLLPALPIDWRNGSVRGLRARGGVEVSLAWNRGRLVRATFDSSRSGKIKVRLGELVREVELQGLQKLVLNGDLRVQMTTVLQHRD